MNAQFNARAVDLAVSEYRVLIELGEPVTPAAFGIAVSHLRERLNLTLLTAAEMLKLELERLAAVKMIAEANSALEGQRQRAEVLRDLDKQGD
jgi:hypothetical protein